MHAKFLELGPWRRECRELGASGGGTAPPGGPGWLGAAGAGGGAERARARTCAKRPRVARELRPDAGECVGADRGRGLFQNQGRAPGWPGSPSGWEAVRTRARWCLVVPGGVPTGHSASSRAHLGAPRASWGLERPRRARGWPGTVTEPRGSPELLSPLAWTVLGEARGSPATLQPGSVAELASPIAHQECAGQAARSALAAGEAGSGLGFALRGEAAAAPPPPGSTGQLRPAHQRSVCAGDIGGVSGGPASFHQQVVLWWW